MKKTLFISSIALLAVLAIFLFTKTAETNTRPYYSGEAIVFDNHIYVGSTNSGYLEIFRSNGNSDFETIASIKRYDARYHSYKDFADLQFNIENGKLYVYTINEYTVYKYRVLNNGLDLIAESTNTYWEWYSRVDKFGSNIVTISAQGVKVLNDNLEVINAYDIVNTDSPYSLRADNDKYILNVNGDYLEVYDRETRSISQKIFLNFYVSPNNHKAYQDSDYNIYVVDDYYTMKYDLSGRLLASFRHLDYEGYDATGSGTNGSFYFSNGMGVVRLSKKDLSVENYKYTYNIAGPGGWAMGLNVVNKGGKDYAVVFNGNSVILLDNNMNLVAKKTATEAQDPYPLENLYLNLNHNSALRGAEITVNGGGYLPNENLHISFGKNKYETKADSRGRFEHNIIVPNERDRIDIKVDGSNSGLTYSISFNIIEKIK